MSEPFQNYTKPLPEGQVPPLTTPGYPQQPTQGYQPQPHGYPQQPQGYSQQPMPPGYQQPYPQQPGMPPIVINNVANASATAIAGGYGRRKRQSLMVHLILLFCTFGIGNVLYAKHVNDWNKKHGY